MKRGMIVVLTVAIVAVFAAAASAAPFIRTEGAEGVIGYQITGGTGFPEIIAAQTDGALAYDLANIPTGTYTLKVSACNVWGCGESADLGFTKALPARPAGLRVSVK